MTAEDKKAYEELADAKIKEWNAKIQELQARADQARAEAKIRADSELRQTYQKKVELERKLEEMKHGGAEAWQTMKSGFEKAADDLKTAFDNARSRLEGK
jgi:anti-sigma-K factor RskA